MEPKLLPLQYMFLIKHPTINSIILHLMKNGSMKNLLLIIFEFLDLLLLFLSMIEFKQNLNPRISLHILLNMYLLASHIVFGLLLITKL